MEPNPCPRCREALFASVRFCPFCGAAQGTDATKPAGDAPEPILPVEPVPDRPQLDANRHRMRAEPPAPLPPPPAMAAPPPPPVWIDRRQTRPAAPRRPRGNPNRAGAIRRLAAAVFVLVCAAVLWRQLVAVPHGTLVVHLDRAAGDAVILVDGISDGPPDRPISLPAGQHRIGLAAAGFDTPRRIVRLRDGETTRLTLFPSPLPATLALDSTPTGVAISIDGRAAGRTPLQRSLSPGRHRIVASAADFQTTTREIELPPGATTPLSLSLSPVPLRTVRLDAPAGGRWSDPLTPGAGTRFTLLFRDPIRVRIAGRVVLLEPGAPAELGAADATGISVAAVGGQAAPVRLLIVPTAAQGAD